jgi:hypothetical protein
MHTYIRAPAGFTTRISSRCLQAVLNTAVCTGFCNMPSQPGTCSICLMGPTHRNRHTHLCQIVVQLGCTVAPVCCHLLVVVLFLHRVCATCCVANTARYRLHGMCLTASRTSMHIYSTLFCCSDCAVAAARSYPDYCCMHRVCASRGSRWCPAARSFRPETSNRVH